MSDFQDPRAMPRFVPTLTEVIGATADSPAAPAAAPSAEAQSGQQVRLADAIPLLNKADEAVLAVALQRLLRRSDFQDTLAKAVATAVSQQVHAQLSGQLNSLTARLPELVQQAVLDVVKQQDPEKN